MKLLFNLATCCGLILGLGAWGCGDKTRNRKPEEHWVRPPKPPPAVPDPKPTPLDEALMDKARQEIWSAVNSNDPVITVHSIEAIRQTPLSQTPEGQRVIVDGLRDSASVVRFASAMAAGELRLADAKEPLLAMTDDPSRNVRIAVRFALHRLGDTRLSHDLEKTARDPDRLVRANTVVALGLLEEKSALNILRPMLKTDRDATIRLQVAESMWRLGNQEGLESLVAASVSAYPDDQMIAFMALAGPRDTRVSEHIHGGLTADYPEVALVAARAMGMLGSDQGYGVALEGARSVDKRQRSLAALALGAIGRSDAQSVLSDLLKDQDADVRLASATALLQLRD